MVDLPHSYLSSGISCEQRYRAFQENSKNGRISELESNFKTFISAGAKVTCYKKKEVLIW